MILKTQRLSNVLFYLLVCLVVNTTNLSAQIHAVSDLYISEGNIFTIQGNFTFYTNSKNKKVGKISTVRGPNAGIVKFSTNSDWSGASNGQFIDGIVKANSNNPFLFPVGANGNYRPIGVSKAVQAKASFVDGIPVKFLPSGNAKTPFGKLADDGYWLLNTESPAQVTLTWNKKLQSNGLLENDLSKLTIIGWKNDQWNIIESSIDIQSINTGLSKLQPSTQFSAVDKGSITTNEIINPNQYEALALGLIVTDNNSLEPTMSLFPNPIMEGYPISLDYDLPQITGGTLQIFYENGALLLERKLDNSSGSVLLSNVTTVSGTYLVNIEYQDGVTISKKLVVAAKK